MRLQVFLSRNGICSRRDAMDYIFTGRVAVNGRIVKEPSYAVKANDRIAVDGHGVQTKKFQYVMMNKPAGYITTTDDPHAKGFVTDLLPPELKHLKPVGRLDKDTEGLLLFTNDGETAFRLTHPKFNVDKTYLVRIDGPLLPVERIRLERGIVLEGERTAPAKIKEARTVEKGCEFLMIIHEGRKRQIRMMLQAMRHRVMYLKRLSQGNLHLGALRIGEWRFLEPKEILMIKQKSPQILTRRGHQ